MKPIYHIFIGIFIVVLDIWIAAYLLHTVGQSWMSFPIFLTTYLVGIGGFIYAMFRGVTVMMD
jgi:hypothetical protein